MATLTLHLFGRYEIVQDGQPAPAVPTRKAEALLVYLAVERDEEHRREELLNLLWSGMPERNRTA